MTLLDDRRYMEEAIGQARLSGDDVPVGALVVLDGRIIGRGTNRRERDLDPTGHAEIAAMKEAAIYLSSWRLEGTTLYSTLEPCPMCAEAAIQSRVSRLVFAAYDPLSGACGSQFNLFQKGRIYPLPEVIGGILEEACRDMLSSFFNEKGRKSKKVRNCENDRHSENDRHK